MNTGGNTLPDDLHLRDEFGEVKIGINGEITIFRPKETLETLLATRQAYITALLEAQKQPSVQTLAAVKEAKKLAIASIDPIHRAQLFRTSGDSAITTLAFTDVFLGAQQLAGVAQTINPDWDASFATKEGPEQTLEALLEDPEQAGQIANQLCLIYRQMTNGAENALYNSPTVEGFFADSLRPTKFSRDPKRGELVKNHKLILASLGAAAWSLLKNSRGRKK